ncbi:MAG: DUF2336 domain-containing protein [Kiloniellaceae bacterium]|nr:DUF2336 domain-containing protein [Kiloniellaceae bacterium]
MREGGSLWRAAARCAVLAGALLLPALPAAAQAAVTSRDIEATLAQMEALGRFFGAFAERDSNGFAQERWRRLSLGYPGTAELLGDLQTRGILLIDDLPAGRVSGLLDRGEIVIDRDLDGRWAPGLLPAGDGDEAARRRDLLLPVLFEALARRQAPQDWPWLADHLRAVGGLGQLAQDPVARPLLARFFQAKDAYLWLAMQRIGEGDPAARQALAGRQRETFGAIHALATDMAATFGPAPAERLQRDWSHYVALVDGFAVTRGWLLLDPALRRTQLGAAARREADAVRQAAAEVVASAPRSALAAARSEAARAAAPPGRPPKTAVPAISLGAVVAQSQGLDLDALPTELATQALALRPEAAAAMNAAAFRDFAARLKEAMAQPDPRLVIADREQQLGIARNQVAALQSEVGELAAALDDRAAESAQLETALAAERARLAASEQRAVAQAAEAERRLAEAETLGAAQRAAELKAAEAPAPEPAPRIAVAPPQAVGELGATPSQSEQRQLYVVFALAAVVVLALLLWLRRRRGAVEVDQPPPLLAAPGRFVQQPAIAEPPRPVVEMAAVASARAPVTRPRAKSQPGQTIKLNGITPPSADARAAMKAGKAQRAALRSAGQDAGTATLGPEAEADAAGHPIVQALRKGNLPLFELLFGELTGLRAPQLQRIAYGGRGEDLVIVCRAVGVDKLLFGSIFLLTDHLRGGDAEEEPERTAEILRMYDRLPSATAQKVLTKWQRNWGGDRCQEPSADV